MPHATSAHGRSAEAWTANRDTVLVRCAAKAIKVSNGSPATALFDGIMEAIGPSGTLVVLAFTSDFYFWQKSQAAQFPFHLKAKSETGAFTQIVLDQPGAVRSQHPTNSFAALGPDAEAIVRGHDENATAFYPIKNLIDIGGKLLLVGCVESSPGFSTVHRVQEDLRLADRTLLSRRRICAVQDGDHIRWFERRDVPGCSAGFGKFYRNYEAAGILRSGSVGGAASIFADASAAYAVERSILAQDPTAAFCEDPQCTSCGLRTYSPVRMARFFLSVPLGGRAGEARITCDIHGSLEANILSIFETGVCRAVFISIDAVFVGRELSDALLKACAGFGVDPQAVLIVASHTHSAPTLEDTKPLLGTRCNDHFASVRDRLVEAVSGALGARPKQATLSKGRATVHAGVNRRLPRRLPQLTSHGLRFERTIMAPNADGPIEPTITAWVLAGETTAVIWHYTCHPTGFPDDLKISADYPGMVRHALRQRFGQDTTVVFLQGFAGDIRPISAALPGGVLPRLRLLAQGPCFHGMAMNDWLGWSSMISDGVMQAIGAAQPVHDIAPATGRISSTALDTLLTGADRDRIVEIQHLNVLGERFVAVRCRANVEIARALPCRGASGWLQPRRLRILAARNAHQPRRLRGECLQGVVWGSVSMAEWPGPGIFRARRISHSQPNFRILPGAQRWMAFKATIKTPIRSLTGTGPCGQR